MCNTVSPKIYDILKKVVNGDIDNFIISVNDANKKGEGYLGQMFFVSLRDKNNGKQLNFAIKQAFSETTIRDIHPIRNVFINEINFYRKLWPKLLKFQEGVPREYRFINLAKCFAAISEENYEKLVFENLKYKGFVMHDKTQPLNKNHFESIFKVYGRLHAISFALKFLNPEGFSEMCGGLLQVWEDFCNRPHFADSFRIIHETCLKNLQPGVDDAIIEKYKHYVHDGTELFLNSVTPGKHTAIVHGDCWSNNMMFKYNDSGELIDLRFLDFQLVMLGSPVCDLSYCLYSGGTKEIFDDLDHFLQVYHDSLSECLRAYGCDPDDIYPFQELKNEWKLRCQIGFNMGLAIWRSKLTYDDSILDLTDISVEDEPVDVQKFYDTEYDKEKYQKISRDIIVHFYENDFMY